MEAGESLMARLGTLLLLRISFASPNEKNCASSIPTVLRLHFKNCRRENSESLSTAEFTASL